MIQKTMDAKGKNVGISMLRLICAYSVICLHSQAFWGGKTEIYLIGVPCFMFLSFYLCFKLYYNREPRILRKRVVRLGGPLIFWNIAYYIFYGIIDGVIIDWRQLIYGVIFGHATELNQPLWFLVTQLIIVVIIYVIYYAVDNNKYAERIIVGVAICAIVFQYSGGNLYLFGNCVGEIAYTFGFTAELLPMAVAGLLFGKYDSDVTDAKNKKDILIIAIMIFLCVVAYLIPEIAGFGYHGIKLLLISITICIIMIFIGKKIKYGMVNRVINWLAKYTLGVYCIHWLIIKYYITFYEQRNLTISRTIVIQIYVLALLITMGLSVISKKVKWLVNMIS